MVKRYVPAHNLSYKLALSHTTIIRSHKALRADCVTTIDMRVDNGVDLATLVLCISEHQNLGKIREASSCLATTDTSRAGGNA